MTITIAIAGTDIRIPGSPDVSILDAAQSAGWELPYSCRKGACNTCRGPLLSGVTTETPSADGTVLFCQARPLSNIEIKPKNYAPIDPAARKILEAKLFRSERAADDIAVLHLRFPAGKRVRFKAGQYLDVLLPDGQRRSFSIANSPRRNDGVELHIRLLPGGVFSGQIYPSLVAGSSTLRIELPFGKFCLREESDGPIILVASGTGFAPIQSILLDLFERNVSRNVLLYWGARRREDLYALSVPKKWADTHTNFSFIPVLSEPSPTDLWEGRMGLVHKAVMDDFETLENQEVYACGVAVMIEAARADFVQLRNLSPDNFFSDSFVTLSDVADSKQVSGE